MNGHNNTKFNELYQSIFKRNADPPSIFYDGNKIIAKRIILSNIIIGVDKIKKNAIKILNTKCYEYLQTLHNKNQNDLLHMKKVCSWLTNETYYHGFIDKLNLSIDNIQKHNDFISNKKFLYLASIHSSVLPDIQKYNKKIISNESLEWLGDRVLNMIIANEIFKLSLPVLNLNSTYKEYTSNSKIAQIVDFLGLTQYLIHLESTPPTTRMKANYGEAIIGALYRINPIYATKFIINNFM